MNTHLTNSPLPATPRFHRPLKNGLYRPISFGFVTRTMHRQIVAERASILAATPRAQHERQARLFARYDPRAHFERFQDLITRFGRTVPA